MAQRHSISTIINTGCIYLIRLYQQYISPRKGYHCSCHTTLGLDSCSQHAVSSLQNDTFLQACVRIRQRSKLCRSLSGQKKPYNSLRSSRSVLGYLGVLMLVALTGCGGGGDNDDNADNSNTGTDTGGAGDNNSSSSNSLTGKLVLKDSANNTETVIQSVYYSLSAASAAKAKAGTSGNTDSAGQYKYDKDDKVTFKLGTQSIGPMDTQSVVTHLDLAKHLCANQSLSDCEHKVEQNIRTAVTSLDADDNASNGYDLTGSSDISLNVVQDIDQFQTSLKVGLRSLNKTLDLSFEPSLGINLEEPQPESDTVGGQPLPFADAFRVARPFKAYSCPDITYNAQGWPTSIPSSCNTQPNEFLRGATTGILRNVPDGAIPEGQYTVFYEGSGTLKYSGLARLASSGSNKDIITVNVTGSSDADRAAGIRLQIQSTNSSNPIRNIRIVMPGGICKNDLFTRVDKASDCGGAENYTDFATTLEQNRNAIVFNPDFLRELRNFKVIRTMNFMKASPRNFCGGTGDAYKNCLYQSFSWNMRSTMNDAVWGGSGDSDTPLSERYGRGVPLEVIVEMANVLKRDPWFNVVHNADDDFVTQFATYVEKNLDPSLKAYVEYTNEAWNGIFWAALYVRQKGLDENLSTSTYWAGAYYYARRATEVFKLWQEAFGNNTSRLVRVLGTVQTDKFLAINMLDHVLPDGQPVSHYVDALAMGGYFYGCWNRKLNRCIDTTAIPKVLSEVTSVDDVFDIINNENDFYGIHGLKNQIKEQASVTKARNIDLIVYEGGQHLVVPDWNDDSLSMERKLAARTFFEGANRDKRMSGLYTQMLDTWKQESGELFVLYTLPQSFHQWGSFGIKEHINKARSESPKYDASMTWQEKQGKCWWAGC